MRDNMADETSISAPSVTTGRNVPIGAEVVSGESTGRLRVFDSGVDKFPDTNSVGFAAVTITHGRSKAQTLASLLSQETGVFPQNFKAKRSITLLADGSNAQSIFVGDKNTSASTTATNCIGFPLKADASITLELTNPGEIFLDCHTADCVLYWIAV